MKNTNVLVGLRIARHNVYRMTAAIVLAVLGMFLLHAPGRAQTLTIDKDDGVISAAPGDMIDYTLYYTWSNFIILPTIVITETVPTNTTFSGEASDWSCSVGATAGTVCTYSDTKVLGSGNNSVTFRVEVDDPLPLNATPIENTVHIGASNSTATNQDNEQTPLTVPNLTLAKAADKSSVTPGQVISYTLTYGNTGGQTATGVTLQEEVPAGATFDNANSTGTWSCAAGTCTQNVDALAGGATDMRKFAVKVDNPVPGGVESISNTATIDSAETAATTSNQTNTTVNAAPNLTLAKTTAQSSIAPGGTLNYTLTYGNSGNQNATVVTMQETVPDNTTFAGPDADWSCTIGDPAGTSCTHTVGELPGGTIGPPVSFQVKVFDSVGADVNQISNQAMVNANNANLVNSQTVKTPITAAPVLSLTKAADKAEVTPGDVIVYTLTYANSGNQTATGLVITETVPANTTFDGPDADWSCSPGAGVGAVCTHDGIGELNGGGGSGSVPFRVAVVNPIPAAVTEISNGATIDAANANPASSPSINTTIDAARDLNLTKMANTDEIAPGEILSYTLTYQNAGNQAATGVTIHETVPAHTTFVGPADAWSCPAGAAAGATCTHAVGTLGGGASGTVVFQAQVNDPIGSGVTAIQNQATIHASNASPATANLNTALNASSALELDKDDGDATAIPGELIIYTLTYTNTGDQAASDVLLAETVPLNTRFDAANSSAGWSCLDAACTLPIGPVPGGAGGTATFAARVVNPLSADVRQIVNTAQIGDNNAADDAQASVITPVNAPDLTATKTDLLAVDADENGAPSPGDTLEYRIAIANNGTISATGAIFNDVLQEGAELVLGSVTTSAGRVTRGNDADDSAVTVELDGIAPSQTVDIAFRITVAMAPGLTQIRNQGSVTGQNFVAQSTDDPNTVEANDATITRLSQSSALSASKTASLVVDADDDGAPGPGDTLRYTLTIENNGSQPVNNVTLTDRPDANTTLVNGSVTTSAGTIISGNGMGDSEVAVDIGRIEPPGAGSLISLTIGYDVIVANPLPSGVTSVTNQGLVTGDEATVFTDDPATATPDDPTVVSLAAEAVLSATQTDSLLVDADGDNVPSPGDTILLEVAIRNSGNAAATNVTFVNSIDANARLVNGSVQASQGSVTQGNDTDDSTVEVTLGDLTGGDSANISFQIQINAPLPPNVTRITSQGTVRSDGLADVLTDDPAIIGAQDATAINLTAGPVLQVAKSDLLFIDADSDGAVSAGDTLFYRVTLVNNGNAAATGILFEDTPDPYTTLKAGKVQSEGGVVQEGNAPGDTRVVITVDALAGGGSNLIISFQVQVKGEIPVRQLQNQAAVTYDDPLAPGGQTTVSSDDPDTVAASDATVTPVSPNVAPNGEIFLPIVTRE